MAVPPAEPDVLDKYSIPKPKRPIDEKREIMIKRITYSSRKRGILETDLLLSTFTAKYINKLTKSELLEFDSLLEESDWYVG